MHASINKHTYTYTIPYTAPLWTNPNTLIHTALKIVSSLGLQINGAKTTTQKPQTEEADCSVRKTRNRNRKWYNEEGID